MNENHYKLHTNPSVASCKFLPMLCYHCVQRLIPNAVQLAVQFFYTLFADIVSSAKVLLQRLIHRWCRVSLFFCVAKYAPLIVAFKYLFIEITISFDFFS